MKQREQALSWYKNNFLSVNPEKFQLLILNPKNEDTENNNTDMFLDKLSVEWRKSSFWETNRQ